MARRVFALALVALALGGGGATVARAAEPASGQVSAAAPTVTWKGSVTGAYPSYAAFLLGDAAGANAALPCQAPSCETFALHVADGGRDLAIKASSPDTNTVSIRLRGPDGAIVYDHGAGDPPDTVVTLAGAAAGDYSVDITTSALDSSAYTATATSNPPSGAKSYPRYTYEKIWRPVVPAGTKIPVVLHLSPYHVLSPAHGESSLPMVDGTELVRKGYAFVFADVRGTWASGGCWDYGGINERHDGYDLVEWLAKRPWANGRVAMMGVSYPGTTPMATAIERPPHLAAIVPISGISRWYGYAYQQGVRSAYSGEDADIDPPSDTPTDFMFAYGGAPPPDPDALADPAQTGQRWNVCDRVQQTLHGYSLQPDYDAFWRERDYLQYADRVKAAVLMSHGLQDFNVKTWEGTSFWERVRSPKMLVLGQWPHAYPGSYYDQWQGLLERFLARWLYGVRNGVEDEPRVHVQTNDGVWHLQDDWGPAATAPRSFALEGESAPIFDDGLLTESEVLRGVGEGVRWLRVPVADSAGPLRFGGRPVLRLKAAIDKPSTHVTAVLCDVASDGSCTVVSRAFLDTRYRRTLEKAEPMTPGEAEVLPLEFIDKDWVVARGHHLELRIATASTTWVFSDTNHATLTPDLRASQLDLPLYG
jgi:X-Pro dipeptidyl-peptidase